MSTALGVFSVPSQAAACGATKFSKDILDERRWHAVASSDTEAGIDHLPAALSIQRDHSKNRSCSLLGSTLWPGRPIDVSVCGAMHRKEGTESRGEIKQSSLGWRQDAAGHKRVSLELERSGKLCGRKAANMPYIKHLHSYSHQRPQSRQQNDQGHGSSATVLNKPDYERHGKRTSKDSR